MVRPFAVGVGGKAFRGHAPLFGLFLLEHSQARMSGVSNSNAPGNERSECCRLLGTHSAEIPWRRSQPERKPRSTCRVQGQSQFPQGGCTLKHCSVEWTAGKENPANPEERRCADVEEMLARQQRRTAGDGFIDRSTRPRIPRTQDETELKGGRVRRRPWSPQFGRSIEYMRNAGRETLQGGAKVTSTIWFVALEPGWLGPPS